MTTFNDFQDLDRLQRAGRLPEITEAITDWLVDNGYHARQGDLGEVVVEYLCDEIGATSASYVAGRYRMSRGSAVCLLQDLEQFAAYQGV